MINTKFRMGNQKIAGLSIIYSINLTISNSLFDGCYNIGSVVLIRSHRTVDASINNSTFVNNTGGRSVITLYQAYCSIMNSRISDNSMTGITAIESNIEFPGYNVIQNNRYTEGAGITLSLVSTISIYGELHMVNNTAENHGGAILVIPIPKLTTLYDTIPIVPCLLGFYNSSAVLHFSDNTAEAGGDNIYGGTLMGCITTETKLFLMSDNPMRLLGTLRHLSKRIFKCLAQVDLHPCPAVLRSASVTTATYVDCSDWTPRHIQTYPGLEINTSNSRILWWYKCWCCASQPHAKLFIFMAKKRLPAPHSPA